MRKEDSVQFIAKVYSDYETAVYEGKVNAGLQKAMEESLDTGGELNFNLQMVDIPKYSLSTIRFKPEDIESYMEVFSLEQRHENLNNERMDSVSVRIKGGDSYTLDCTLKEFEKVIQAYYDKKDSKVAI